MTFWLGMVLGFILGLLAGYGALLALVARRAGFSLMGLQRYLRERVSPTQRKIDKALKERGLHG